MFAQLLALFAIYAVLGWICECIFVRITEKQWINRGFMIGPYIPIYACGALILLYGCAPLIHNPLLFFVFSILVSTSLEYMTSVIMEQMFHARWWDYSHRKFNFQGRVCLLNSSLFGVMACGVRYVIQPFLLAQLDEVSRSGIVLFILVFYGLFSMDFLYTLRQLILHKHLIEKMEAVLTEFSIELDSELDTHFYVLEEQIRLKKEHWQQELSQLKELTNGHLSNAFPHRQFKHKAISIDQMVEVFGNRIDKVLGIENNHKI